MSLGYPAFEPLIQVADVTGAAYALKLIFMLQDLALELIHTPHEQ